MFSPTYAEQRKRDAAALRSLREIAKDSMYVVTMFFVFVLGMVAGVLMFANGLAWARTVAAVSVIGLGCCALDILHRFLALNYLRRRGSDGKEE
jgi:uncharacterized membrane protein YjjP (DUF1212 family)